MSVWNEQTGKLLLSLARQADTLCVLVVRQDGTIVESNRAADRTLNLAAGPLLGERLDRYTVEAWEILRERLAHTEHPVLVNIRSIDGDAGSLRVMAHHDDAQWLLAAEPADLGGREGRDALLEINAELMALARERARQRGELVRLNERLTATLEELESSYFHIRKIHEFIPFCMQCGRLKGAGPGWSDLADYLREHDILVSHGYCPDCGDDLLARLDQEAHDGAGNPDGPGSAT